MVVSVSACSIMFAGNYHATLAVPSQSPSFIASAAVVPGSLAVAIVRGLTAQK